MRNKSDPIKYLYLTANAANDLKCILECYSEKNAFPYAMTNAALSLGTAVRNGIKWFLHCQLQLSAGVEHKFEESVSELEHLLASASQSIERLDELKNIRGEPFRCELRSIISEYERVINMAAEYGIDRLEC